MKSLNKRRVCETIFCITIANNFLKLWLGEKKIGEPVKQRVSVAMAPKQWSGLAMVSESQSDFCDPECL